MDRKDLERKILEARVKEAQQKEKMMVPSSLPQPVAPEGFNELESAGLGAAQGLTFGFADEGEAALRSALSDKTYDDVVKEVRDRYSQAEEQNPISFFGGNVAGGLVLPAGALGAAAKGASTLAKAGKLAQAGAVAGGLTSLGTTENDKLSMQALRDAGEGALVGGGLSAALGAGIPALGKGIGKYVKGTEVAEDIGDVYRKIRSGEVKTFGREALPDFSKKVREAAKVDILGNLDKLDEYQREAYKSLYKQVDDIASQKGNIPVEDMVGQIRMKFADAELKGVDANDIKKLDKNLSKMVGEAEQVVEKEVLPDTEKILGGLKEKAAVKQVMTDRNEARKVLKKAIQSRLAAQGLEGDELANATEQQISKMTSAQIDDVAEMIRTNAAKERVQVPASIEKNPDTGLDVAMIKRADGDIAKAIPEAKMEQVKEIVNTRTTVSPKELSNYIQNVQSLIDSAQNPQYKKMLLEAKDAMEKSLRSNSPQEFTKAKEMLSMFYREVLDAKTANLKLPGSFDTSPEGRKAAGQAVDSVQNMISKYSDKSTTSTQNLDEFFNKLKGINAEEVGLSSTGKTGPATIDDIKGNIQNLSRNLDLAQKTASQSSLSGASTGAKGLIDKLQMSAKAKMLTAAEASAKGATEAAKVYNKVADSVQKYTPDMLVDLAGKVKNTSLANILNNAAKAPDAKRKALIFSMMQQPAYREAINDVVPVEE